MATIKPGSRYAHLLHAVRKLDPGEAFVATQGEDFECLPESFRTVVYALAQTKGGGWVGTACIIDKSVVYAFFKASDYLRPNLPAYPIVKSMRG